MGLKRISVEKAEGLIKITNDLDNAKYFTITPTIDSQKASEGWESVTYYSDKKRTYQIPTNVPNAQWVYVLSNPSMPGLLKIGYSKNNPHKRVKQLLTGDHLSRAPPNGSLAYYWLLLNKIVSSRSSR